MCFFLLLLLKIVFDFIFWQPVASENRGVKEAGSSCIWPYVLLNYRFFIRLFLTCRVRQNFLHLSITLRNTRLALIICSNKRSSSKHCAEQGFGEIMFVSFKYSVCPHWWVRGRRFLFGARFRMLTSHWLILMIHLGLVPYDFVKPSDTPANRFVYKGMLGRITLNECFKTD